MIGVQVTTRLYKRVGPRRLMIAGMCGTVTTIGLMALAGPSERVLDDPAADVLHRLLVRLRHVAGADRATWRRVTAAETGHASTLVNTVRQAGGAAGVALLGTVLAATGAGAADLAGYHLAFLAAAGLMALGVAFSCFVNDADAAPTMAASPAAPQTRYRSGLTRTPASLDTWLPQTALPSSLSLTRAMLSRFPLIDGHNDLPWVIRENSPSTRPPPGLTRRVDSTHTDIPRLVEGGVGGQFWSVYVPASLAGDAAVTAVFEQVDLVHRMIAAYPSRFQLARARRRRGRGVRGRQDRLAARRGGRSLHQQLARRAARPCTPSASGT